MSEQRFVILKYKPDDYDMKGMPSITESELKRRLSILKIPVHLDLAIEIIMKGFEGEPVLHGDGKEWPDPEDIIKMRGKPSPAPTREWESHAKQLAEKHVDWHLGSMRQFGIDNFVHGYKHRMEEDETHN